MAKSITSNPKATSPPTDASDGGGGKPRSRFQAAPGGRVRLGPRDETLLTDLYLHDAMSRRQLQALHFGSVPRCNARLRQLFDGGYVGRYFLPLARYGSEAVYTLGRAAAATVAASLAREGLEADTAAIQAGCRADLAPMFLEHTLAIVDFSLALRTAAAACPGVSIERWLPEKLCRHEYDLRPAHGGPWRREVFKPDAFVRLADARGQAGAMCPPTPEYLHYFVEIDRGHVSSQKFLGKLEGHRRYLESGLFGEMYGGTSFRTLVVTTGPRRLQNLRALVEADGGDLFWLATEEAVILEGAFAPIWQAPGCDGCRIMVPDSRSVLTDSRSVLPVRSAGAGDV